MIKGSCHCGQVTWRFDRVPETATACNCTVCRRYAALWAYGYEGEDVAVSGETSRYIRGDSLADHFCPHCGCVTHWLALEGDAQGRLRIAVNLRLAEPDTVADIPLRRFDGLDTFQAVDALGMCVRDLWT